ncbi:hypothetical protein ACF0H5_015089 [Mactra antiquata]
MATSNRNKMKYFLFFTVYVCLSLYIVNCEDNFPSKSDLKIWSDAISSDLTSSFDLATNYDFVTRLYNNYSDKFTYLKEFELKFEKMDVKQVVADYAKALSDMLYRKMEALNRSVDAAEKAAANHTWNNNIKKTDIAQNCLIAKNILENDTRLVHSDRFKQEIIPNISSVHIPVEIYDGDIQILNGLKWSAHLDKTFVENYENDEEILWQYFGSQTGFMRTLPASRWDTGDEVDLYDVRRRPWYTQGSSSPKDMLILIDTSGSVYGQALELMKVAVKSLLDTLGENDFVYIAQFSEEAHGVSECFNGTFVQANYLNKMKLREEVDGIKAKGMADFQTGLEFAFKQFVKLDNETEGRRGAGCNRMIMLLTDGDTDDAEKVFKKYNPKDNQNYRVFTYAVGPTANPVAVIKWMACANRGYFSQIPAMGAVRSKVQEYLVASAQVKSMHKLSFMERVQFRVKHDVRGLGMMTTVTLPVYNKTDNNGTTDQTILGVMGIDVTTEAMLKLAPLRKFGPNGFPFAINANGYIVFHPDLKVKEDIKDPPNVDFLDVEVESKEKEQLRKDMILQNKGEVDLETYIMCKDERHVDHAVGNSKRKYVYQGIDKTTFSVGASVPLYHKYNLNITMKTPITDRANLSSLLNDSYTALLIANWEYFENFTNNEDIGGTVLDLLEALNNANQYKWNRELIDHLLFDLSVTKEIDAYWDMIAKDTSRFADPGFVVGAFIATNGGLTKIYPKSEDLVTMLQDSRDPWKATYFKRAIEHTNYIFSAPYVSEPFDMKKENLTAGNVMAVKSVSINNSKVDPSLGGAIPDYRAAVLGAVFSHDLMQQRMQDKARRSSANTRDCSDPSTLACYLIDDGGFLIATNQEKYNTSIGRFFGRVDPHIMYKLYGNQSIYQSIEHYDFLGTCMISDGRSTSAGNINIPLVTLLYEFLTFNWWTSVVTWTFTNLNIYSFLYPEPVYANEYFNMDKTRDCYKKNAQYYFTDIEYVDGYVECEIRNRNCTREFMARRLPKTNLLFIVSDVEDEDCSKCKPEEYLIQESEEVRNIVEAKKHFCSMKPRFRRATSQCYDKHEKENTQRCTGAQAHPVSMVTVLLVTMVSVLFVRR